MTHVADSFRQRLDRIARTSHGRVLAALTHTCRDLHAAEDALAAAWVAALRTWPDQGEPDRPEAWLLTVARRRLLDQHRRTATRRTSDFDVADLPDLSETPQDIPDQRLRLLFTCAHPALDPAVRAPMLLQCVLGLSSEQIAGRFLTSPAAMKRRLTRAKTKLREAGVAFEVPEADQLDGRIGTVLDAIYAAFGVAHDDALGDAAATRVACDDALDLARAAAELLPTVPEALGLAALCGYCRARADALGDDVYVPLDQQDPTAWDPALIKVSDDRLRDAAAFGKPGRYQFEAALQSAHIERLRHGGDHWPRILVMYDTLLAFRPTLGAALGRAVALSKVQGPTAGLAALDALPADLTATHQPFHAVRAALLAEANDPTAPAAFDQAIALTTRPAVRRYLVSRKAKVS
ncbi:MAG: DUF6596 domain-containing protein [Planctomycetota bacterium]